MMHAAKKKREQATQTRRPKTKEQGGEKRQHNAA
jgi:hypothetical protein